LIAGLHATLQYIADQGRRAGLGTAGRREAMLAAFAQFCDHERGLATTLLQGLRAFKRVRVLGIADLARMHERCSTISIQADGIHSAELAAQLGELGFFVGHGNCYALRLSEELELESRGGFLRLGLVHYNTQHEVQRLLGALEGIVS
jgi:selenocysteine lyase/cysteine desulfurase